MIIYYLKLLGQFYLDMKRQKLRTLLTLFGLCWGTIAVVLLLAFGIAFKDYQMKKVTGLGTNLVIAGGASTAKPYKGLGLGRPIRLREEDIALLAVKVPEIQMISPENDRQARLSYGRKNRQVDCLGIYPEYALLRNFSVEPGGRFINRLDYLRKRRTVFIGDKLRDELFGKGAGAVGKVVNLNGAPFIVVGVLKERAQESPYMRRDSQGAFIAFSTHRAMYGQRYVNRFIFRAADPLATPRMKKGVYSTLGRIHKFDPADEQALWMWDTSEGVQFVTYFFLGFQAFLALGGALTLLVGGIGVANIMYIVVRERRREIGIKMALGGLVGFGLSYGVLWVCQSPLFEKAAEIVGRPAIDPRVALGTIGLLGLTGFAAGFAPARRAANMNPVKALEF